MELLRWIQVLLNFPIYLQHFENTFRLFQKYVQIIIIIKNLLHSLGLVYKSMRGMMTNSIDRDQWLNVTSESRDTI
jgi:hypothetical protein